MRGLLGAILLAPAVASALVVPGIEVEDGKGEVSRNPGTAQAFAHIGLPLPSISPDEEERVLGFKLEVLNSEQACGFGNVTLDGQVLPQSLSNDGGISSGSGPVSTARKTIVVGSWSFYCVKVNGVPDSQLLKFVAEVVDGKAVQDVGFSALFRQNGPEIMTVETDLSIPGQVVANPNPEGLQPIDHHHGPHPSFEEDMAELDYLWSQLREIKYLIHEKERALAHHDRQRANSLGDCDSLRCVVKAVADHARNAAHHLYGKVRGDFNEEDFHHSGKPHFKHHKFDGGKNHTRGPPRHGKGNHTFPHPPPHRPRPICRYPPPPHFGRHGPPPPHFGHYGRPHGRPPGGPGEEWEHENRFHPRPHHDMPHDGPDGEWEHEQRFHPRPHHDMPHDGPDGEWEHEHRIRPRPHHGMPPPPPEDGPDFERPHFERPDFDRPEHHEQPDFDGPPHHHPEPDFDHPPPPFDHGEGPPDFDGPRPHHGEGPHGDHPPPPPHEGPGPHHDGPEHGGPDGHPPPPPPFGSFEGPGPHGPPHNGLGKALQIVKFTSIGLLCAFLLLALHRRNCAPRRRADRQARKEEKARRRAYRRAAHKHIITRLLAKLTGEDSDGDEDYEEKEMLLEDAEDGISTTMTEDIHEMHTTADVLAADASASSPPMPIPSIQIQHIQVIEPIAIPVSESGALVQDFDSMSQVGDGEELPAYEDNDGSDQSSIIADGFRYTPGSSNYTPGHSPSGSVSDILGPDTKN